MLPSSVVYFFLGLIYYITCLSQISFVKPKSQLKLISGMHFEPQLVVILGSHLVCFNRSHMIRHI